MSLGTWFRDYVYIPLGGNRKGLARQILNISIVWLLTGFWHGASWNYVLWGVFYGVLLIIEKFFLLKVLKKAPAFVGHIYTLLAVVIGWVLFGFEDISKGIAFLGVLFGGGNALFNTQSVYMLLSFLPLLLICGVASTPLVKNLYVKFTTKASEGVLGTTEIVTAGFAMFLSIAYLISGSYNPFLYFRF